MVAACCDNLSFFLTLALRDSDRIQYVGCEPLLLDLQNKWNGLQCGELQQLVDPLQHCRHSIHQIARLYPVCLDNWQQSRSHSIGNYSCMYPSDGVKDVSTIPKTHISLTGGLPL